ncbi:MAG: helix-turn-helix domain-containing protein [Planctomycetes bacterium]|nr:helix-turn-helix domain-containing protein [Planctomycetota bacterium]
MARRNVFIVLDRSEITTLEHFMKKADFRTRKRAQAVWLSHNMKTVEQISKELNCSEKAVYTWLMKYKKYGIKSLSARDRKKKLAPEQLDELISLSGWSFIHSKGKSKQWEARWSFKKMSLWIKDKWGITLSPERVRQIIHKKLAGI